MSPPVPERMRRAPPPPEFADNFAEGILAVLTENGIEAAGELRERLKSALKDYAVVYSLVLAGQPHEEAMKAAQARIALVTAGGLVMAAGQLRSAIQSVLWKALEIAFKALK